MMMMVTRSLQIFCLTFCSLTIIINAAAKKNVTYDGLNVYSVNKTIVHSAVSKGAVCLDGSPPAYHFSPGFGEGAANWIVYLSGGAWCATVLECLGRSKSDLGSSDIMGPEDFNDMFSKNQSANPDFYNWNKVFVRYCDGASFTGDVEYVDPATNLHFRGARIVPAILEDLLPKGLKDAKNAILAGSSAGGYPAILFCDHFHKVLPNAQRVKCLVDSGYFVHLKNPLMARYFETLYKRLVTLHGSAKVLPKSCTSKMKPELCLFGQNIQEYVKTPLYIFMSAFDNYLTQFSIVPPGIVYNCVQSGTCSASMKKILHDIRSDFLSAIPKGNNPKQRGVFIDSMQHHSCLSRRWSPGNDIKINNLTAEKAFADWYFDRNHTYVIDYEHDFPLPNLF